MSTRSNFYGKITDEEFENILEQLDELSADKRECTFWNLMSQIWQEKRYSAYFYANHEQEIQGYMNSYLGHDTFSIEPMSKKELNARIERLIRKTGIFSEKIVSECSDSISFLDSFLSKKISISDLNSMLNNFKNLMEPIYLMSGENLEILNPSFLEGLRRIFAGYFYHRATISRTTFNQYNFFIESSCDTMTYGDVLAISCANEALNDKKNAMSILYDFSERVNAFSIENICRIDIIFHPINNGEIKIAD